MPQVIKSLDDDLFFHVMDIEKLLSEGIALPDVAKFFDENRGEEFLKNNSGCIQVPKNSYLYLPAGWLWYATIHKIDDTKPGKRQKKKTGFGSMVSFPVPVKALLEPLQNNVVSAIKTWSSEQFIQKSASPMWQARKGLTDNLFK